MYFWRVYFFAMSIYLLDEQIRFPHPSLADKDGLLAVGGDLSPERLLLAYENGIFPWFGDDSPILWWSPDPRMVLIPEEFILSKSLSQTLRLKNYEVRVDGHFREVITACARVDRKHEDGTWIVPEIVEAYCTLHEMGYAHSFETYRENKLVGGLYGISLGRAFFGESMFYLERDASKVALAALVNISKRLGFQFIDAQQETTHLASLGAKPTNRNEFFEMLRKALNEPAIIGKWTNFNEVIDLKNLIA